MAYNLSDKLVVAVSSRALFDLEIENKVFEEKGLDELLSSDAPKESLYEYLAISRNRPFMEFLINELGVQSCYLASILIEENDLEFSYLENQYMDETYLNDSIYNLHGGEFGMMSDFADYPYGYGQ